MISSSNPPTKKSKNEKIPRLSETNKGKLKQVESFKEKLKKLNDGEGIEASADLEEGFEDFNKMMERLRAERDGEGDKDVDATEEAEDGDEEEDDLLLSTNCADSRLCPFCDRPLWTTLSHSLESLLKYLSSLPHCRPTPTPSNPASLSLPFSDSLPFCTRHDEEMVDIPEGIAKGYPEKIDWDRVHKILEVSRTKTDLKMISLDPGRSEFFVECKKRVEERNVGRRGREEGGGVSSRKLRNLANQLDEESIESEVPGYLGLLGIDKLISCLSSLSITSEIQPPDVEPLDIQTFTLRVLVPEAGWRVIKELSGLESKEEAIKVMRESRKYGIAKWKGGEEVVEEGERERLEREEKEERRKRKRAEEEEEGKDKKTANGKEKSGFEKKGNLVSKNEEGSKKIKLSEDQHDISKSKKASTSNVKTLKGQTTLSGFFKTPTSAAELKKSKTTVSVPKTPTLKKPITSASSNVELTQSFKVKAPKAVSMSEVSDKKLKKTKAIQSIDSSSEEEAKIVKKPMKLKNKEKVSSPTGAEDQGTMGNSEKPKLKPKAKNKSKGNHSQDVKEAKVERKRDSSPTEIEDEVINAITLKPKPKPRAKPITSSTSANANVQLFDRSKPHHSVNSKLEPNDNLSIKPSTSSINQSDWTKEHYDTENELVDNVNDLKDFRNGSDEEGSEYDAKGLEVIDRESDEEN